MPLTVTITLPDTSPLDAGVSLDLLSGGAVVATASSVAGGTVTFAADPSTLTAPAVRVSPQQSTT